MIPPSSAIVLAGGKSRRLGRDKRHLRLGSSRTQIEETIARVSEVAEDVVVAVATDPLPTGRALDAAHLRARIVVDAVPDAGPLGGLCSALAVVAHDHAIVVACDLPWLSVAALRGLLDRPRDYDLLVPRRSDGRLEMLHAVYRRTCLDVLGQRLAGRHLRLSDAVDDLIAAGRIVRYVDEADVARDDPGLRTFFNVNTPADLAAARRLLAETAES